MGNRGAGRPAASAAAALGGSPAVVDYEERMESGERGVADGPHRPMMDDQTWSGPASVLFDEWGKARGGGMENSGEALGVQRHRQRHHA